MKEILIRFFIGGLIVSIFAVLGDLFKPKSFAGLFGAAPSVALATLLLTVSKQGNQYAATEAHSMLGGAVAFFFYGSAVSWFMMHRGGKALWISSAFLGVWAGIAFGFWSVFLK